MKIIIISALMMLGSSALCQETKDNYEGVWLYEVKDTPYGNFAGKIYLDNKNGDYIGKIVNDKGREFTLEVMQFKGNQMIISSNVEDSDAVMMCAFFGKEMQATIEIAGDDFLYKMQAKRTDEEYDSENDKSKLND